MEGSIWFMAILCLLFLSACSRPDRLVVDRLNARSYAYHYRDIDSTETLANQAYELSENYGTGRAEALNNLAFVNIVRMEYDEAEERLHQVEQTTGNQLQLLISYVQQMRLCQRRSRNREFHEYRELADQTLQRINEERSTLSPHDQDRLRYAETEYAIVNSTYYYYVGLERKSIAALMAIRPDDVQRDTAQYLNYLYNIGAGGIITQGTQQDINQQEFDHLMRCFLLARQGDYPYFAANALEALSEHLMNPEYRRQLTTDNLPAMKFLSGHLDDRLPGFLAENALNIFNRYGDVYQIAGAYRTLAACYRQMGDYESALFNLEEALADSAIYQAPDLVASICEQLSVAYAAINDKPLSDYNRNLYLDLQETTRQDRQLEARASQYERMATQLNIMLAAVVAAILLLLFSLWLFNRMNRRQRQDSIPDELFEQRQEELDMLTLRIRNGRRRNLEQRAKISLANSILPFIDRIIHEVSRGGDKDYIRELTDQINDYNDTLTHWIQLRQGELNLHVESFPLQPLFDIVSKGRTSFQMKGIQLNVYPTEAVVKADRVLTLFMLNTLADNARKYTDRGGSVDIDARDGEDFVEITVADTGCGMTQNQLDHLFDVKPVHNDPVQKSSQVGHQPSHGFGLVNCKGIIEKYRKMSKIFSVCTISASSQLGKGSRLTFRLPKGGLVKRIACLLAIVSMTATARADDNLSRAAIYADSAYFSNINGTYGRTLLFADSCRYYLNRHYRELCPDGRYLMLPIGNPSLTAPEISWYHDSLDFNYHIILDIRNESAVAALALHEWQLYAYNNRIYTQLFKEMSADNTLGVYCRAMQQSQSNKTIAVILLVILLLSIVPAYYLLYYRHRLYYRFHQEQQRKTDLEMLDDELRRAELEDGNLHVSNAVLDNCLSTLKHETMYYPSRIRQLLEDGDNVALKEVAGYYREIYGLLSRQAMREVERAKLQLTKLDYGILGDRTMIEYLFEIIRKQIGQKNLQVNVALFDQNYVELHILMPGTCITETEAHNLFSPSKEHIPWLLCRQIVRDHGEASNRRGCGIGAELTVDGQAFLRVILPAAKSLN